MLRAARRLIVILASVAAFAVVSPVGAAEPVAVPDAGDAPADVEPAGATACDIRLSVLGGPLVDENFSVRAWEPFYVWGFGFPADTSVFYEFFSPTAGSFTFSATTDSTGEFRQQRTFAPGDDTTYPNDWTLTAEPVGGGCVDGIALRLQSPYPFTDIDGFEREIAWLYREAITGGCSATKFCPNASVTRGQMAAFLTRTLALPGTTTDFFTDDDGTLFENDINALAASGITGGCAAGRYCPNSLVTRQQMASFLTRAFALPASGTEFFSDDNASVHENDINALAASGITGGCAPGRYCPTANVTREQIAAFLYRAFN